MDREPCAPGRGSFTPGKKTNTGKHVLKDHTPSTDPVQLYNVFDDIGERKNVAAQHPELVEKLQAAYDAHVAEIKANQRPVQLMTRPENPVASPDRPGGSKKKKRTKSIDWTKIKIGDIFESSRSPDVSKRPFSINATVEGDNLAGVVVAQGWEVVGYSLYINEGDCVFSVRLSGSNIHRVKTPVGNGKSNIKAGVDAEGNLSLQINEGDPATSAGGLLGRHPSESFCIGHDDRKPVDAEAPGVVFSGRISNLKVN